MNREQLGAREHAGQPVADPGVAPSAGHLPAAAQLGASLGSGVQYALGEYVQLFHEQTGKPLQ